MNRLRAIERGVRQGVMAACFVAAPIMATIANRSPGDRDLMLAAVLVLGLGWLLGLTLKRS